MSSFADDSSDDDIPIAQLLAKKKEAAVGKSSKPKTAPAVKKDKKATPAKKASSSGTVSKAKPVVKKSSTTTPAKTSKSASKSNSLSGKVQEFYATDKGMLVQKFLVRWWYAMEWPDISKIPPPPVGYEALDGFPGVFICTSQDNAGHLIDERDESSCPSLKVMAKKSSQELKELCEKAIEAQIRQLREAEGEETNLEATLRKELREVKGVKPDKADKAAAGIRF